MPAPETVSEAVAFLQAEGYVDDVAVGSVGTDADDVLVDYTFRFEGPSDPADEAIVMGLRRRSGGRKQLLVSAFGPDADPAHVEFLLALSRSAGR